MVLLIDPTQSLSAGQFGTDFPLLDTSIDDYF